MIGKHFEGCFARDKQLIKLLAQTTPDDLEEPIMRSIIHKHLRQTWCFVLVLYPYSTSKFFPLQDIFLPATLSVSKSVLTLILIPVKPDRQDPWDP